MIKITFFAHHQQYEFGRERRLKMNLPHRHLCTLEMSRLRLPRLPNHTLETIYLHLFPDAGFLRQNHRSLDDARMTARIWLKLTGE